FAEEDRQDPGREGIERAAVSDALNPGQPPDQGDHVVRGRPGRFREDEDAVEVGPGLPTSRFARAARIRLAQRTTSAARRSASARTTGRAASSVRLIVAPAARAWPPPPNRPVSSV